jgi:isoleucyl-tRNA synthetase
MPKNNDNNNKSIPELEGEVLRFWKDNKIFEKSVEQRPEENLYVFYDGPPFISGLPHYGHLLGSIAKDIIPRYWTMKGKRVERVWGWDAHGLTVENKVQKRLGIKNRKDIEAFGLEKFTEESYKYTSEVSAEWEWYIDRIGRWVDFSNSYKTIDQSYMESVMWAFKQLYEKGLIYEGVRTSLYCTTCGTPVSNFEVAMDNSYKEVEDPAITVKFPVTTEGKFKGANILAWTTTPWTIPSNRALVVDKNALYVLVEAEGSKFIVAKDRFEKVFEGVGNFVREEFPGSELIGLDYDAPYTFFEPKQGEFKVYAYGDMVNMEEGTGIVHSAPGFGEIDTEMGRHYGLTIMLVIDDEGKFIQGNAGENQFTGMFYAKANKYIREDLVNRELLFKDEKIIHRFPYHDRCDTLLIQKAQNSWFIKVSELKPQLIENNQNINWVPSYLKDGRFKQGIQQAPDWCISRNRFWATPMPVWEAEDGDRIIISSVKELEELSGQKVEDLHRPYIDKITINKNGKVYKRRSEVLDSWMEAGSMPYAQIHYPFDNVRKFEQSFPGDYIVEYIGQVRAWFYVMHVLSTALFDSHSFKNVISTGVMSGSDGRKMSKTYGNYADPRDVLTTYGGDALRLYLMNSPLMVGDNANFDEVELRTKLRNVINPLWNSLKFFDMYAKAHAWDYDNERSVNSENILDRWITARLHETIRDFSTNIENYLVPSAVRAIEEFVDDLSRWYVRRSRDRISSGDNEALSTLFNVLYTFSKASAPIIPFISENIYLDLLSYLKDSPESVHLCEYPEFDSGLIETSSGLLKDMQVVRDIVSLGHSIRISQNISVRQPLEELRVDHENTLSEEYLEIIKDELNVKKITLTDKIEESGHWQTQTMKDIEIALDTKISEELKLEGNAREMIRKFQDLRKNLNLSVTDRPKSAVYPDTPENRSTVALHGDMIKERISVLKLHPGDNYEISE